MKKKWLIFGSVFIILLVWLSMDTYKYAFDYKDHQKEKAIELATKKLPAFEVLDVSFYNGNESYTILYGIEENKEQIVCVPIESKLEIITIDPSNGITAEDAIQIVQRERNPVAIKSVNLGIEQNVPIWEIIYVDENNRYSYYYVRFQDGEFIKRYTL
jgi:uncharacterized protein YpmB